MTACDFCGAEQDHMLSSPHWTGTEYVRANVCRSSGCRGQLADAPRKPRRKRETRGLIVDGGGWVNVPGLNKMMADK